MRGVIVATLPRFGSASQTRHIRFGPGVIEENEF
jgi:hypothetical protein